jgi:gliding motility-associated lipoprotein GldH
MRKILYSLCLLVVLGLASCHSNTDGNALLSRTFTASGWERFDFITKQVELKRPTTYNLNMEVTFAPSYAYDHLTVVFTVFDANGNPLRAKNYHFRLKDADGQWKSDLKEGGYTFNLPINSELSLSEAGTYMFQLENRMPITPLEGIKKIAIINQQ